VVTEGRVEGVLHREKGDREHELQVTEAADRAGALVTEQIRSIIGQAETSAEEIRRNAEVEAEAIKQRATESASRLLQRIDAINGPLAELAAELRREVDGGVPAESGH
jgi:cell division septum initiation protein DivIVA